jgi:thioredoxin 1
MALIEADEENFQQALEEAFKRKEPVLIKFGSEYCEPCHALEFELEELDEESENISIIMVDTDESPELAEKYDVFALPTMVIYDINQQIIYHKEGIILAEDIRKIINSKEK